jgi:predicted  nucleic acid-binding Zn-ribbon protein
MSTFIGKIMVVAITTCSLLLLGISTVAYSTARNWQTATTAELKKIDELKKKLQTVQQDAEAAKKGLEDAKADLANDTKTLSAKLASFVEENKSDQEKSASAIEQLGVAEETAQKTLEQVQAKREQISQLHQQQAAVEKQASSFRAHQVELNDRIRELERILDTAAKNHSELHKPAGKFSAMVR